MRKVYGAVQEIEGAFNRYIKIESKVFYFEMFITEKIKELPIYVFEYESDQEEVTSI